MVDNASDRGEEEDAGAIIREQDRLLPIANVGRIMKQILPPNAKISKEAKETMQESVSEFIAFVTAEASDKCRRERRKTVNGDDVCWALASLGFDDYALALRRYLQRFRDLEGDRAAQEANRSASEEERQEQLAGGSSSLSSLPPPQLRHHRQQQAAAPVAGAASRSQMMSFGGREVERGSSSDSRQQF